MKISGDINLKFTEEGLKIDMKDFNINNFCIDNVFKEVDKKRKKILKKSDKKEKNKKSESSDDDMLNIEIVV